jgi:hypothetical protein
MHNVLPHLPTNFRYMFQPIVGYHGYCAVPSQVRHFEQAEFKLLHSPTASQWAQKSVTLTSYANQTNLYIMFRFTSNGGNNIYLDDINIFDATTGIDEAAEALTNFNVYPNPADDNTNISFNLIDKQKVELKISDMLGRQLSSIVNSELNAGEYLYPITEKDKFSAGIYFVTLNIGQQQFTKKLIIK